MNWVVLSYSLASKSKSSPRVALWRRLRRLGAVSPTGGIYLLPAREDCIEAFQWLAQEIQQLDGQAVVMEVGNFHGIGEADLIELFHEARFEDYEDIAKQAHELDTVMNTSDAIDYSNFHTTIEKLYKQHAEVASIDYFNSPHGITVAAKLADLSTQIMPDVPPSMDIAAQDIADYQHRRWVTRPRPHVDRLSSAWLIRRFIDPAATIRYSSEPEADEISFDMDNATFGHWGNLCTFETMIHTFRLDAPGLKMLAKIVHDIDLKDERHIYPEVAGIDAVLQGWRLLDIPDLEREALGIALFDGLLAAFAKRPA